MSPSVAPIKLAMLILAVCAVEGRPYPAASAVPGDSQPAGQAGAAALIRVETNLITVPVSVTDSAGHPVRDLQLGDFSLKENDNLEQVTRMSEPGQSPVELALMMDLSGSIRPRFELERQAAARFLARVLRPEDRYTIYSIGPRPGLVQAPSSDLAQGLRSLADLAPSSGSTAFYDAVVLAARALSAQRIPGWRRVEVVLSDGEDNNSESWNLAGALEELQRADCLFYSINPAGQSIMLNRVSMAGEEGMHTLAEQTGGGAFISDRTEDLSPIFDRIAAELRAQYLLEYYSSDQRHDGAFRRISVSIPARPDLHIHARRGYYSQG